MSGASTPFGSILPLYASSGSGSSARRRARISGRRWDTEEFGTIRSAPAARTASRTAGIFTWDKKARSFGAPASRSLRIAARSPSRADPKFRMTRSCPSRTLSSASSRTREQDARHPSFRKTDNIRAEKKRSSSTSRTCGLPGKCSECSESSAIFVQEYSIPF
jgi:hypothetical protein